jgi:hypothetical protein
MQILHFSVSDVDPKDTSQGWSSSDGGLKGKLLRISRATREQCRKVQWPSWRRILELIAYVLASAWFVTEFVIGPSQAIIRAPPFTRELHIYITFLNVMLVLLAVRSPRTHLRLVPLWLFLLWLSYLMWFRHG